MVAIAQQFGEFHRAWRWPFGSLAALLTVVALTSCDSAISSRQRNFQIGSASMAPRWLGPHRYATCNGCRNRFPVSAEIFNDQYPVRCFCCGALCVIESNVAPGNIVTSTPVANNTQLERFDIVVFREPSQSEASVKRIWGLPGERLELTGGEMLVDGKLFRKNLQQLVELAVAVSRFPDDSCSHWDLVSAKGQEAIESAASKTTSGTRVDLATGQRICFTPKRPAHSDHLPTMIASQIVDDYACNQGISLPLHTVGDFLIALRLSQESRASVWRVHMRYQDQIYRLEIGNEAAVEHRIPKDDGTWHSEQTMHISSTDEMLLAMCDGQAFIAASQDGTMTEREYLVSSKAVESQVHDESDNPAEISQTKDPQTHFPHELIEIEVLSGKLVIDEIVVARDLWLGSRHSRESVWTSGTPVAANCYWVLGDNLPISVDCREAWLGGIPRDWIEGTIKREPRDWRRLFAHSMAR